MGADEWVIGGIVGATVMDDIMNTKDLAALDAAAGGRPVLLRDDSMHNRWVNSRALELMIVGPDTPDPEGGTYVRDESGALSGVLQELASAVAEAAADAAVVDPDARNRVSLKTALETLNSFGITSVQDAATMAYSWKALSALEADKEVTAWVVGSMPARNFIEVIVWLGGRGIAERFGQGKSGSQRSLTELAGVRVRDADVLRGGVFGDAFGAAFTAEA